MDIHNIKKVEQGFALVLGIAIIAAPAVLARGGGSGDPAMNAPLRRGGST